LSVEPNQLRWDPVPLPSAEEARVDFVQGLQVVCGAGDPSLKDGLAIYNYSANACMGKKALYNSDGDFLIVPQLGTLYITTELGRLSVEPCEIVVIPRGIKFNINLVPPISEAGGSEQGKSVPDESAMAARGYVLEVFKGHFEVPSLGE